MNHVQLCGVYTKVAAWKMELLKMYFLFKMRDFNGFYQPAMFSLLEGSS